MIERVPPHDMDAEQALVASCLADRLALVRVMAAGVMPEDFYVDANGLILGAAYRVHQAGKPADLLAVRDALGNDLERAGGWTFLCDLAESIPTTAHAEFYAGVVLEKAQRRAAIRMLSDNLSAMFDTDAADPVSALRSNVLALPDRTATRNTHHVYDVAEERYDVIARAYENRAAGRPVQDAWVTMDLPDVDSFVKINRQDMVILGARPSTGKTALALQVMDHIAMSKPGHRTLVYSLEMSKEALLMRYFAQRAAVPIKRLRSGYMSENEFGRVKDAWTDTAEMPLYIDDRGGLTTAQILASAQRQALHQPLAALFVDHLSLVRAANPKATPNDRMGQIANDFMEMKKILNCPVFLLAQLSRESEKDNRKPRMSDLRDSGTVEQNADIIVLLHRPNREGLFSEAEALVPKNRDGGVADVSLVFNAERMRFECQAKTNMGWS